MSAGSAPLTPGVKMAVSCNAGDLIDASKCFACLDTKQLWAIKTYLLQLIAGNSQTMGQLADSSSPFTYLSIKQLQAIEAYQLCQLTQ